MLKLRDNSTPAMRHEIFGPVVPAMSVRSFEEALSLANDRAYGLSACVYTRDLLRLMRLVDGLESGEIYSSNTSSCRS